MTHSPAESSTGRYELVVSLTKNGDVPELAPQTILLDFDGGSASDPLVGPMVISPFDAEAIDASYVINAAAGLHQPNGRIYVLDTEFSPLRVSDGAREPLVLRANAGSRSSAWATMRSQSRSR